MRRVRGPIGWRSFFGRSCVCEEFWFDMMCVCVWRVKKEGWDGQNRVVGEE